MEWIAFAASVIVALLSLIGTVYGSRSGVKEANKLVNYKIDELTARVNKHNNLIERVYKLEQHEAVIDEKIDVANHRIADLEEVNKNE